MRQINNWYFQESPPAEAKEDAMESAMKNPVVLRIIFSYLPLNNLKKCSLVDKTWNFEVRSYIRDFRQCNANISEVIPCFDLHILNDLVSHMTVVPINSLTFNFGPFSHSDCKLKGNETNKYEELLKKLPLKYLYISWDIFFGPKECPAIRFVVSLLLEKTIELHALKFYCLPLEFKNYFHEDWNPWLPKLKVLNLGIMDGWVPQKNIFLKIVNGATNLKKLKGYFDPAMLDILPEDKYSLLDNFRLSISSAEEEKSCFKLAKAEPALSVLFLNGPTETEGQYKGRFFRVLEKLLSSSCKTLEELSISYTLFPLGQLTFPALVNMKILNISTSSPAQQLLNSLRTIDFPRMLPTLSEVQLCSDCDDEDDEDMEAIVAPNNAEPDHLNPSKTVKKLKLELDVHRVTFSDLKAIFPNVTELEVVPRMLDRTVVPYTDLWAAWPNLEIIDILEGMEAFRGNIDAEFLGIFPEEVEYLRDFDDKDLEKMNLVPIIPSVLNMQRKLPSILGL